LADSDMDACLGTRTQPVVLWLEARRMAALAGMSAKETKVHEHLNSSGVSTIQHLPRLSCGNLAAARRRHQHRGGLSPAPTCTPRAQYRRLCADVPDSRLYPDGLKFSPSASLGAF